MITDRRISNWGFSQLTEPTVWSWDDYWKSYVIYPQTRRDAAADYYARGWFQWMHLTEPLAPNRLPWSGHVNAGLIDPTEQFIPPEEPKAAPKPSLGILWGNERWGK